MMDAYEYGRWIIKDGWDSHVRLGEGGNCRDILRKGGIEPTDANVQKYREGVTYERRKALGY